MNIQEKFAKPSTIDGFGYAPINVLVPPHKEIPPDYQGRAKFEQLQSKWFFKGLDEGEMPAAKPGIDEQMAMKHLYTVQNNREIKHEHKIAGVAWLMSMWFELPKS